MKFSILLFLFLKIMKIFDCYRVFKTSHVYSIDSKMFSSESIHAFNGKIKKLKNYKEFPESTTLNDVKKFKFKPYARIDKILNDRGIDSRKNIAALIKTGKVYIKEGKSFVRVKSPSTKFQSDIIVKVKDQIYEEPHLLALYHKPSEVLSVIGDSLNRTNLLPLYEKFPHILGKNYKSIEEEEDSNKCTNIEKGYLNHRLHPVGRLDFDSSGLLLFSRDGQLTQKILNPKYKIQKEYEVFVKGKVDLSELHDKFRNGVRISDGIVYGDIISSHVLDNKTRDELKKDLINKKSPDYDIVTDKNCHFSYVKLALTNGLHRVVRRSLFNAGYPVFKLHRTKIGEVQLGIDIYGNQLKDEENSIEALSIGNLRICSKIENNWAKALLLS